MKKLVVSMLLVLMLVTGCGKVPKLENGQEAVISLDNGAISVDDLYEEMKDKYDLIGDVRGFGLSIGVDLVKNRATKIGNKEAAAKICYRCWEKGIILIYLADGVLRIQPPLVISKDELDTALSIIEESIVEYLNGEIPDEVLSIAKGW